MGHSTKRLDLTGQRYGKLTVLEPAQHVAGRTTWRCRCDCGQITEVRTDRLREGHTISCGCVYRMGIDKRLTYVDGTCLEMIRAGTVRRNNTSGVPGVSWTQSKGLWRASICFKGKRHHLGYYARFEDAVRARRQAEETLHAPFLQEFEDGGQIGTAAG